MVVYSLLHNVEQYSSRNYTVSMFSSLPLPTSLSLNRDCIGTLMPLSDNNGRGKVGATIETAPFIVNSTEIIKMAIKCRDFKYELSSYLLIIKQNELLFSYECMCIYPLGS